MSGLRKAKKYDWKDSNLALFGSDVEKNVKKESAKGEPAWQGAGEKVGIQVWRIVKFEVTHWPKEDYGKFFNGDTYIVLHTYKKDPDSEELSYDVHFWIGKESTQDEYGTAAYKTVELDTFLDDKAVQHREVQGNESNNFKDYFDNFVIMKGGADSGFNKVEPESYKPRLITVDVVKSKCRQTEKKMKRANMKNDKVRIIDLGRTIYQWNGKDASRIEVFKARCVIENIRSERCGKVSNVQSLDNQTVEDFHPKLATIITDDNPKKEKQPKEPIENALFRLSDASGRLEFNKIASGDDVNQSLLNSKDVFILETERRLFVWTGEKASVDERRKSLVFAHRYLQTMPNSLLSITCFKEGDESDEFWKAFD